MAGRKPTWTDEQFIAAVRASASVAGTCRALGLVPLGGNYRTVRRTVARLGLDTSHWTGQGWSRGLRLGVTHRRIPAAELFRAGRAVASQTLRSRLVDGGLLPQRCARCGLGTWLDASIPLEVDHVNGDPLDNRLENLRLMCPNCHALTGTYRGRNIGRGGRARAMPSVACDRAPVVKPG